MRSFYAVTVTALALAGGCYRQGQQSGGAGPAGTPFEDLVIGESVSHGNLAIFPIVSKTARTADRFITLDEGLAAGTVKIVEVGTAEGSGINPPGEAANDEPQALEPLPAGQENPFGDAPQPAGAEPAGDVNRLMVLNTSGRPLYLMPGEVISGGKQDRTIGEELVIASGDKPVEIDVYCVEHARWQSRSRESSTQLLEALAANNRAADGDHDSPAHPVGDLVIEASKGKFVAPAGQAGKDLRLAIQQSQDQGEVWDEVQQLNAKVGSETPTGTFVAAYADKDINERLAPYLSQLRSLAETERIVGVAVCIDGQMRSADVFESTPLFRKFWPKLLKSYALDAIAGESPDRKIAPCTRQRCLAFLKETSEAAPETKTADTGHHARRETAGAISFSYYNAPAAGAAQPAAAMGGGMGMGGMQTPVHSGVFAK